MLESETEEHFCPESSKIHPSIYTQIVWSPQNIHFRLQNNSLTSYSERNEKMAISGITDKIKKKIFAFCIAFSLIEYGWVLLFRSIRNQHWIVWNRKEKWNSHRNPVSISFCTNMLHCVARKAIKTKRLGFLNNQLSIFFSDYVPNLY